MTTTAVHHRMRRIATAVAVSSASAITSAFLAAAPAAAFTYPDPICNGMACSYKWCPGMPLPLADIGEPAPNWDMNVCHRFSIGTITADSPAWANNGGLQVSPRIIEGDPGPCPGCVS